MNEGVTARLDEKNECSHSGKSAFLLGGDVCLCVQSIHTQLSSL